MFSAGRTGENRVGKGWVGAMTTRTRHNMTKRIFKLKGFRPPDYRRHYRQQSFIRSKEVKPPISDLRFKQRILVRTYRSVRSRRRRISVRTHCRSKGSSIVRTYIPYEALCEYEYVARKHGRLEGHTAGVVVKCRVAGRVAGGRRFPVLQQKK